MRKAVTENIAVKLLIRSSHPDRIYAEVIKITIIDLLSNTCKVTAVEGRSVVAGDCLHSSVSVVVGGIAVLETVCQQEVYRRIIPGKC